MGQTRDIHQRSSRDQAAVHCAVFEMLKLFSCIIVPEIEQTVANGWVLRRTQNTI